ncbi:sensor histidine kinase [Paenibacillus sp.]|uniref:sensor histidine kinase n=1 Tax=Paenibacillus sp. TaxID=58172 RepID=UPI002D48D5DC|nr:histidine kinase [Paenibacillus sp.]HZG83383.1 histidine kinase [Paenibacillus sp.]
MKGFKIVLNLLLYQPSIIRTIFYSYLLCSLFLFTTLGFVVVRDSTSQLTKQIFDSANRTMEQMSKIMEVTFREAQQPLIKLALDPAVIEAMTIRSPSPARQLYLDRSIADIASSINIYKPMISDILILGKNGYVNNLDNRFSLKWDYPFLEQSWVKTSFADAPRGIISLGQYDQDFYNDNYKSKAGLKTIGMAYHVYDPDGNVLGSVICNFDLKNLFDMMSMKLYDRDQVVFVIDQEGAIVVHHDLNMLGRGTDPAVLSNIREGRNGHFTASVEGVEHLFIYQQSSFFDWYMLLSLPMSEILGPSVHLKSHLYKMILASTVILLLLSLLIALRIWQPVHRLLKAIDQIETQTLTFKTVSIPYWELNRIQDKFKSLLKRIDVLVVQNYASELALKNTTLQVLQSQINPHFMFNTLQMLQTEIMFGDKHESSNIVLSLSKLLRYSMNTDQGMATLREEADYLQDYIRIASAKLIHQLSFRIRLPEELDQVPLPKLTLQPFVENCLKHGFPPQAEGAEIKLRAVRTAEGVLIRIRDNGRGIPPAELRTLNERLAKAEPSDQIGMNNAVSRLKLCYGSEARCFVRSKPDGYTSVFIFVPYHEGALLR